jgi:hypothetical protein
MATHIGYLVDGVLPLEYFQQTQGQLLVTGFQYCDFLSYYPGIKPLHIRVEPDKKFQAALKAELEKFCTELNQLTERLR